MRSLIIDMDANHRLPSAIPQADHRVAVTLSAGQAKSVAVPAGARLVMFSATGDFWARIGGAASVPAADILDGSAPELNPAARSLQGAGVIGIAAAAAATVNLVFFG